MVDSTWLLTCGHPLSLKSRQLRIGEPEFCRVCFTEQRVARSLENWTIKCIHIEHSMCRTYGIDKGYAIERAFAHTRKYGRAHICMVYQRSRFDETMELAIPAMEPVTDVTDILGTAMEVLQTQFKVEEIPF